MIDGLKSRLRTLPVFKQMRIAWWLMKGGEARSTALLRLSRPDNLFQPFSTSAEERYPAIFQFARRTVGDGPDRRILSFGCAKGEEVFSLRRHFPQAFIKGIDINPRNIAAARIRLRQADDPAMAFQVAGSAASEDEGAYDAIFAMAVFRHGELGGRRHAPRCDHLIRFEDFEETVAGLARCLKPGGVLLLHHANFLFSDTSVSAGFSPIFSRPSPDSPLYGRDNRLLRPKHEIYIAFAKD